MTSQEKPHHARAKGSQFIKKHIRTSTLSSHTTAYSCSLSHIPRLESLIPETSHTSNKMIEHSSALKSIEPETDATMKNASVDNFKPFATSPLTPTSLIPLSALSVTASHLLTLTSHEIPSPASVTYTSPLIAATAATALTSSTASSQLSVNVTYFTSKNSFTTKVIFNVTKYSSLNTADIKIHQVYLNI
ncbi:hypothetical protein EMPG_11519 [Blastomyces silverae]|uniref:Uncharacterized protein n=1 Tax=Blastomyces silverae TaxID=2060906 RepID=A0A0H1BR14_9EURO|nr:hypothetical protein EMPG_11519 [Blastomyces silverae]